jgi:hypothetical protein
MIVQVIGMQNMEERIFLTGGAEIYTGGKTKINVPT